MYGCVPQGVIKREIPAPADGPYGSEASDRIFINKQEEWKMSNIFIFAAVLAAAFLLSKLKRKLMQMARDTAGK